ncbi:hypothetical protein C0989_008506 [Termitomyces sp. Mn162]|nr:hypothetical protein C0989_008506 [Termitomyces sp. Mn162]
MLGGVKDDLVPQAHMHALWEFVADVVKQKLLAVENIRKVSRECLPSSNGGYWAGGKRPPPLRGNEDGFSHAIEALRNDGRVPGVLRRFLE